MTHSSQHSKGLTTRGIAILIIPLVLPACTSVANKADTILEMRIAQMERSVSKVKSETIAEAKGAAAALIANASEQIESSGKEVIRSAADQLGAQLDRALDNIDKKVDAKLDRVEEILDKQRSETLKEVHQLVREDIPVTIRDSVVKSADGVAERLGVVKKTVTGPDGLPIEVWVMGGIGVLGGAWTFFKTFIRMRAASPKPTPISNGLMALLGETVPQQSPPTTPQQVPNAISGCSCPHCKPPTS